MKNQKMAMIITLLVLISCKGGGGGADGEASSSGERGTNPTVISSNVTLDQVRQKELSQINEELNNPSNIKYQLSEEELSSLVDEGALSHEEKNELSGLTHL
ncbi:MAG: hypothetical protein VXV96_11565 [Bdellovibrionota bacterium]|nr:hypothetical protein [Bdellovibrionota bacterium]